MKNVVKIIIMLISHTAMNQDKQLLIKEPWITLPGGYGEDFAFQGKYIAGVQANRLTVWNDGIIEKEIHIPIRQGGYPQWKGSSVYWGDGRLDMISGQFIHAEKIETALNEEVGLSTLESSNRGYIPVTYAWSPDAQFVLVSVRRTMHAQSQGSSVILLKKDGTSRKKLWDGNDFTPKVAWMTNRWIAVGTRNLEIYNYEGKLITTLPGKLIPERIETNHSENRLLVHRYDGITIWNTDKWNLVGFLDGLWLDAAIDPSGEMLIAVDFDGNLHFAVITDKIQIVKKIIPPDPIASVTIGINQIVAAFSKGDPVRLVSLKK